MNPGTLRWLDRLSIALLLLWAGVAVGIAAVAAPAAFQMLPTRDLAGKVIGTCFRRVDLVAWGIFGLAFALSYGARWLAEVKDPEGIGPMQLWSGAWMAVMLMCFASSALVNPKLEAIRSRIRVPIENLAPEDADRAAFNRAHRISEQLLGLRILLALALAGGIPFLPNRKDSADTQA